MDPWLANRYAGTGTHEPATEATPLPPSETRTARRHADAVLREVSGRVQRRHRLTRALLLLLLLGVGAAAVLFLLTHGAAGAR